MSIIYESMALAISSCFGQELHEPQRENHTVSPTRLRFSDSRYGTNVGSQQWVASEGLDDVFLRKLRSSEIRKCRIGDQNQPNAIDDSEAALYRWSLTKATFGFQRRRLVLSFSARGELP